MKKIFLIITTIMLSCIFFFCGCSTDKDYIPEVFGEWDGYYLYYGGQRMKTTGEDVEPLLAEIEIEQKVYRDVFISSTLYEDDHVYMCVGFRDKEASDAEYESCLLKYNLSDKTYNIIYRATDGLKAFSIRRLLNNVIFLTDGMYATSNCFVIDYDGNILLRDANEYDGHSFSEKYIVSKDVKAGSISYRKWGGESSEISSLSEGFKTISLPQSSTRLILSMKDNLLTILAEVAFSSHSYYIIDMDSHTLYTVFLTDGLRTLQQPIRGNYFIVQDISDDLFDKKNCILYEISENFTLKEIYRFPENKQFKQTIADSEYLYFTAFWKVGCGYINKDYKLNLSTLKLKSGGYSVPKTDPKDSGWVRDKYIFYQTQKSRYLVITDQYYYLHRYNTETGKDEIMHYFCDDESYPFAHGFTYEKLSRLLNY